MLTFSFFIEQSGKPVLRANCFLTLNKIIYYPNLTLLPSVVSYAVESDTGFSRSHLSPEMLQSLLEIVSESQKNIKREPQIPHGYQYENIAECHRVVWFISTTQGSHVSGTFCQVHSKEA